MTILIFIVSLMGLVFAGLLIRLFVLFAIWSKEQTNQIKADRIARSADIKRSPPSTSKPGDPS